MKLGIRSVIGYGAGDFANNLAFSLSTTFLLLYYTDVVGLPAAAIGTMFLIVRLWDAFADLFAGRMVDRTMTRWGKFRPFILFGSIPLLVMSVLTFSVPQGWDGGAQLMYAYLTYAVLGLIYSMVNVPYGSLATAMTQVSRERAKLAVARGLGAGLGGLLLTFIIAPQIQTITENKALSARGPRRPAAVGVPDHHPGVRRPRVRAVLPDLPVVQGGRGPHRTPGRHQGHLPDPEDQQAAGHPVRLQLLLPDRPVRGRRRHRLLRDLRARRRQIHHLDDPGHRPRAVRHRALRPHAGRPVRQEEPLPVLRPVHRRRRRRPVLHPRQPAAAGAAVRRRQGPSACN